MADSDKELVGGRNNGANPDNKLRGEGNNGADPDNELGGGGNNGADPDNVLGGGGNNGADPDNEPGGGENYGANADNESGGGGNNGVNADNEQGGERNNGADPDNESGGGGNNGADPDNEFGGEGNNAADPDNNLGGEGNNGLNVDNESGSGGSSRGMKRAREDSEETKQEHVNWNTPTIADSDNDSGVRGNNEADSGNMSGGGNNGADSDKESDRQGNNNSSNVELRDRLLPLNSVFKIMKKALPNDKISRDAKLFMQLCASEIIYLISYNAADASKRVYTSGITGDDILRGIENFKVGFTGRLKLNIEKNHEHAGSKKGVVGNGGSASLALPQPTDVHFGGDNAGGSCGSASLALPQPTDVLASCKGTGTSGAIAGDGGMMAMDQPRRQQQDQMAGALFSGANSSSPCPIYGPLTQNQRGSGSLRGNNSSGHGGVTQFESISGYSPKAHVPTQLMTHG